MEILQVTTDELLEWVVDILNQHSPVIIRIRGNSMFPFLRDNRDLVTLRAFGPEDLRPGTIILFKYETKYLLHRILRKKSANYYLRGDNNWSFLFETCTEDDVVGVVVSVERNGRQIACDSWKWRFCSFLWMKSHFLRVVLYRGYCFLKKN